MLAVLLLFMGCEAGFSASTLNLAGRWRFALDQADNGLKEQWPLNSLPAQITLPGALQSQGFGNDISTNTPWVLSLYDHLWYLREDYLPYTQPGNVKVPFVCQPPKHYLGAAWYQRDVHIPSDWRGRRLCLFLERPHWESRVWLDGRPLGSCNSLVAPHEYELGQVEPGDHTLSIRVDNRMILPYRPDAHSVSDSLGDTWNGIAGRMELRATSPVWIDDAQAFPNLGDRSVLVRVRLGNLTGKPGQGTLTVDSTERKLARGGDGSSPRSASAPQFGIPEPIHWEAQGGGFEFRFPLGPEAQTWDEFHPALQHLRLQLLGPEAKDDRELMFGLRDFHAQGQDFMINGRRTHLRGTHHGGDFALTGYPATDVSYWRKLFGVCREWGLNHMRFHSFCPPEAAFTAADEMGFYLQPEAGMWNDISPGTPMEKMLYEETRRMLKAYGNHPSFVMLSPSNEPKGRWKQALPKWVERFRQEDPRHLYTTGTGWALIDAPGPVQGADYLSVGRIGGDRVRGESAWFGRDYSASLRGVDVPVVAHELGQWCAFPDPATISKFTGYFRPGNYEIFRDSLARHGLLNQGAEYARASGRFQFLCYKEEIEANLRTPGLAGFQLLDLHDYVGQGTALVGLLDPFWEPKGCAKAEEFRQFCGPTVPLARLTRRIFTTAEALKTQAEVAHYGAAPIADAAAGWRILDAAKRTAAQGQWPARTIPVGRGFNLGEINANLAALPAPGTYTLEVSVSGKSVRARNRWTFWLYPAQLEVPAPPDILITSNWDAAEARLAAGGKVLFLPRPADLDWSSPPLDTVPVFWNRLMNPGWGRMLGLWCDARHPALAEFPTEAHCDWQWATLLRGTRPVNLDKLPAALRPVVAAVDDWNRNYKLGLVFECRVGPGRLVVCSADIRDQLEERPVARQLRRSLLNYMDVRDFQPKVEIAPELVRGLWFDTRIMNKLGARVQGDGTGAGALIDADPNTYWTVGGSGRNADGRSHPHSLTITFPTPVAMNGVVLMNRQNDRDHLGDIREFTLQASDDGQSWREVAHGQLASTWNPQTVRFATRVTARQLKLTARSGFGGDTSAALAELAVLYAGPKLPDDASGEIEYKRVRSTSSDVDESAPGPTPGTRKGR